MGDSLNHSFLHDGSIGDVFASIPTMNQYYLNTGNKVNLYLTNGQVATYYEGATHPTRNSQGEMVMLNEDVIEKMKPLLMVQPCINSVSIHNGEKIEVDLNEIRRSYVGMPALSINRWYFYVYPNLACDLSKEWLHVPDSEIDYAKGKIIISRSERYNNDRIDYSFLKEYEDLLIFSGTMREYNNFCMSFDLNVKKLHDKNFLEVAQAVKQSKFHITNQTSAFQISDGLKHPRILETCGFAPNCIVNGKDGYDFLAQVGLEYYFHKLNGTIDGYIDKLKTLHKQG